MKLQTKFSTLLENIRGSHWVVFCKKNCFFFAWSSYCRHGLNCSGRKAYSHRTPFFSTIILPEIRAGSFSLKFRCSGASNKFTTTALPMVFYFSIEHLNLQGHCKYLLVSSLRIKNCAIIFPRRKQIPQRNTTVTQENNYV